MEAWEVAAREAIRDLVARYAQLADRGRFADLAALFTDDGVLEVNDRPPARGREAILALLTGASDTLAAASPTRLVRHHVASVVVDVASPDSATASAYFLVVTDVGPDHWGRYRDQLVQQAGRWLFRHRRVRTDGHAPGSRLARG